MTDQPKRRGESDLIAHYFVPLCDDESAFGLTDDAAIVSVPDGKRLVVTKDMLVADIHFFANDPADLIAQKALRVNLSDLAAKGATPLGYVLGLGLPLSWTEDWLAAFVAGLKRDQQAFSFPLLGGDTVKSPERLTLSITAFGTIDADKAILRRNARPGDHLYVTGTIGDGALGLKAHQGKLDADLSGDDVAYLSDRFLLPRPRTDLIELIRQFATASMDISDGLIGDAAKMASAAQVGIKIEQCDVPLSSAARHLINNDPSYWQAIMSGGDDYELLFCIPDNVNAAFLAHAEHFKTPVTKVGRVWEGNGVTLTNGETGLTTAMDGGAYEHF